jgi:hypothetical protein
MNFQNWFIGWMILALLGYLLFHANPNIEFKKKYTRMWIVFAGITFVAFAFVIRSPIMLVLFLVLPMATLVTYVNFKIARICGNCGRYNQKLSSNKLYCRSCGMEITD